MPMLMVQVWYCLSSPVYDYYVLSPLQQVTSLLGRLSGHAKILDEIPTWVSIWWWCLPEPTFTMMVASDLSPLVLAQHLSFGSWCSTVGERPPSSSFIYIPVHSLSSLIIQWFTTYFNYFGTKMCLICQWELLQTSSCVCTQRHTCWILDPLTLH